MWIERAVQTDSGRPAEININIKPAESNMRLDTVLTR